MELPAGTWQYLLSIAGVFVSVALGAFALIAFCGLLAHAERRRTQHKARQQHSATLPKNSATKRTDYKK